MSDLIHACAACGTKNRLVRERLQDDPRCGKCGGKVFPREPVTVSDRSWSEDVLASPIPVLVDVWAPWCGPCQAMGPVIDDIARERAGRLKVAKLESDANPATAGQYRIRSIPTLLLFRNGQLLDQTMGVQTRRAVLEWVDRLLT